MEHQKFLFALILSGLVAAVSSSKGRWRCNENGSCSFVEVEKDGCRDGEFRCSNNVCIERTLHCDGKDDCGDNSDEVCEEARRNGVCPWSSALSDCAGPYFKCRNSHCISRTFYCDGFDDCGDNSDEAYCSTWPTEPPFTGVYYPNRERDSSPPHNCPSEYYFSMGKCTLSNKCIRNTWFCDGIEDCPGGTDEINCDVDKMTKKPGYHIAKALYWLHKQRNSRSPTGAWGPYADKAAVALYLASNVEAGSWEKTREELAYEVSIQLLSKLSWKKLQDIPSSELASFVNAFLVTCLNPRNFHGLDIVRELRSRTESELTNRSDPYVLLSLCNAGELITQLDKTRLVETFRNKKRTFWTDTQAVVIMALACASKRPFSQMDLKETLKELTLELKQRQYRNGTVENLHTTALVMQALLSSEPDADTDNFDERKAMQQILAMQDKEGSFGSFMNTYYVLPVLNCKSLVDISSEYCGRSLRNEIVSVRELGKESGPKIHVHYSVWIGNDRDLERTLTLAVQQNRSLYSVIKIAAESDSRFRCEYTVQDRKPYVNAVDGLQNDPEGGKFWFLYTVQDGNTKLSQDSPVDIIPKENEHFVMWYRNGPWLD